MQSNSEVFSGSPTIELLDHTAITSFPYSWEYDKYPVGMYSAPISTINFNLSMLPDEFIQMLFSPFLETTVNVRTTTRETTRDIPITFQAGNLFRLYTDFGRGAGTIYEVFRGCQNSGFTNAYSNDDMNFPVDVIDFGRAVLESCSANLFKYTFQDATHNTTATGVPATLDLYISNDSWTESTPDNFYQLFAASQSFDQDGNTQFYYVIEKEDIDDWVNTCVNAVALSIMRKTGSDIFIINDGNGLPFATYYKQHHEASPTSDSYPYRKGDAITNIVMLAGISSLDTLYSFDPTSYDTGHYGFATTIMEEYADKSFWDVISDWLKNELKKGCFSASTGRDFTSATTDNYYLHVDNLMWNVVVSLTNQYIEGASFLPFAKVLKQVTSSFIEKADSSQDIDSFDTIAPATRSGENTTVSILFNSIPVVPDLKDNSDAMECPYDGGSNIGWLLKTAHYFGVYYLATPVIEPGSIILLGNLWAIRAWHIPKIYLGLDTSGDQKYTSDLTCNAETEGSAYAMTDDEYYNLCLNTSKTWAGNNTAGSANFQDMWDMIAFLNRTGGKGGVVANTLLYMFGSPSQYELTGDTFINFNLSEQWFLPRSEVTLTLADYLPSAVDPAEYNSRAVITSVSVELTTGRGQFNLLGRRLGL